MYLNFGSYRYRGSDICTILLLIPKSTPNTFRASGFGSTYHTYYTWIFARRYARAADSVVEVCWVNEEFKSGINKQKSYYVFNSLMYKLLYINGQTSY